jgi:hypothetical protein
MCNAGAMAALVGVQGGLKFAAQQQAYKMQKAAVEQAAALRNQQTLKRFTAENMQELQETESENLRMRDLALENQAREATAIAARGEGVGIEMQSYNDLAAQFGRVKTAQQIQQRYMGVGKEMRQEEIAFAHTQDIARIRSRMPSRPNIAIALAETGLEAARAYKTFS